MCVQQPMPDGDREGRLLVTNIQRFSLHDGPGIRTTLFVKGCSVCCPWCANPENIRMCVESYMRNGEEGLYGRWMGIEEARGELLKDRAFYRDGGGVTYSGGEPLVQSRALSMLAKRLREDGVHQAVETALFVPREDLERMFGLVDLFIVDAKVMDSARCRTLLGGDIEEYLANLELLFGATDQVLMRIPLIGGQTDAEQNLTAIAELARRYRPLAVEVIVGHSLAASKYASLGLELPQFPAPDEAAAQRLIEGLGQSGIPAAICRI